MPKVRVGFVGAGSMGQCAHLKNYATLKDECEVVALAELRPELARRVAERYGVPRVYRTHEEMLERERLDAIVAAQSFTRHGLLVPELLAAGIPVFTEKPLAASIEAGEKIVAAAEKSGTWHMVGYHKRSDPATMYAKAEIERLKQTGELGRLRYVRIIMPEGDWIAGGFNDLISTGEPYPSLPGDPPASDMDRATFEQYAEFVDYYIHQVNLLRHLLGEPYKVTYADPSGVLLAAQSESGIAGTIEMSPYATTLDWQESALVAFQHGYVKIELPAPLAANRPGRIEVLRDPAGADRSAGSPGERVPETTVPQLPWVGAMRQQAINFLRAVRGEVAPMCQAREALEDLRVARDYLRLLTGN
jgi:predicted dehydrogenase